MCQPQANGAFVDQTQLGPIDAEIARTELALRDNAEATKDAQFLRNSRSLNYQNQRANFKEWIETRSAVGYNRTLAILQHDCSIVQSAAIAPYEKASRAEILKVFLLHPALTLPLLRIAG